MNESHDKIIAVVAAPNDVVINHSCSVFGRRIFYLFFFRFLNAKIYNFFRGIIGDIHKRV